jgi:hypothetical protein
MLATFLVNGERNPPRGAGAHHDQAHSQMRGADGLDSRTLTPKRTAREYPASEADQVRDRFRQSVSPS